MDQIALFQAEIDRAGPVAPIKLGPADGLIVAEPLCVDHVLKSPAYGKGAAWLAMRRLLFPLSGALSANDDLASWRAFRAPVNRSLARSSIKDLVEPMASIVDGEVAQWPAGVPFELSGACARIIQKLIVWAFFGAGISPEESARVGAALVSVLRLIAGDQHRGEAGTADEESAVLQQVISRIAGGSERGLAGMYAELEPAITTEILLNLFLAGYETPSLAIAWTLSLLATRPEVHGRLIAEMGRSGPATRMSVDNLHEWPELTAVVNEGMRLYTPLWAVPREAFQDDTLPSGHRVSAGTIVMLSALHLHRLPAIWGEDAAEFRPERFLDGAGPAARDRRVFIPFGAGMRICPAELLARAEMMICLGRILERFSVELLEVPRWEPAFTLRPKDGINVVLSSRSTS